MFELEIMKMADKQSVWEKICLCPLVMTVGKVIHSKDKQIEMFHVEIEPSF